MSNRFFTILVIPEKTSQVRRFVIPSWVVRSTIIGSFFLVILAGIMVFDYWYVMNQISENKALQAENRQLKQRVQIFENKMSTIEGTLDRIKTFATRLKVITNIEDRGSLLQSLNQKLPDATKNIGLAQADPVLTELNKIKDGDPEKAQLRREYEELDHKFSELNQDALLVEATLQDQYELLSDQKSFLAALPTRKPAVGYFTSGFGIRHSPFGGKAKMHEGLDIANHPGTPIQATADGVVTFADIKPGYGQTVIIDHGYGLETWYGHAKKVSVTRGQKVKRGDPIALLGNTGRSTGPHVHYEVRIHGTPVDPLSYILEN